jgi:hypothetical protein
LINYDEFMARTDVGEHVANGVEQRCTAAVRRDDHGDVWSVCSISQRAM